MKPFCTLCISFLFVLIASSLSAQERVSTGGITFTKKSERLMAAKGWAKINGQWIGKANRIPGGPDGIRDTASDDNFYWLQSASFIYGGKKYYTFFCFINNGAYRYPSLEEGWYTYSNTRFAIMTTLQYQSLKLAIKNKSGKPTQIACVGAGYTPGEGDYDENELQELMISYITLGIDATFYVNAQTLKGDDVVRFLLPATRATVSFDSNYFEAPALEFKKLLID